MFRNSPLSLVALGLVAAPVAAQAPRRTASPLAAEEGLAQGSVSAVVISIALFAGLLAWIVVEMDEDDEEEPVSP